MGKVPEEAALRKGDAARLLVGLLGDDLRAFIREEVSAALKSQATDRRIRHDRISRPKRALLADIRSGKLRAQKVGKYYYVEPDELDRYFAAQAKEKPAPEGDEFEAAMQRAGLRKGCRR
ncbi:hypothetical protein WMF18_01775 [Sorangium sp. So ce315]|uniref:hypothetical protein n=1 Tax=unclassified Sorangium TaxID=2621164 RepID=UPI003F5FCAD2